MGDISKTLGLTAIIATASCSSTVDTARLLENFRESTKTNKLTVIRGQNNTNVYRLEDYVIEQTKTGSTKYSLYYTRISNGESTAPSIFITADRIEYDEIGTPLSTARIRDGNISSNLDGKADSGYMGGMPLNQRNSQKLYKKIASKVTETW